MVLLFGHIIEVALPIGPDFIILLHSDNLAPVFFDYLDNIGCWNAMHLKLRPDRDGRFILNLDIIS